MTIQTPNLILAAHLPRHLRALVRGVDEFENTAGLKVADGIRDQLLGASPEFVARIQTAKQPDPWSFGFAIIHKIDHTLIGLCGFSGSPNDDGVAEIAYAIAPGYQGQGFATEAAQALIQFASADPRVKTICAHTLSETNASTRILEKCGFEKIGGSIDPENNLPVWRWEKTMA